MNDYELWFNMSNLSYCVKRRLLDEFKNVEEIWYKSIYNNEESDLLNNKIISALKKAWDTNKINLVKDKIKNNLINTVVITDDLYPQSLKVYEDSPYMLFYKGNIQKLNKGYSVAIVGSRSCTSYGVNVTNLISKSLCDNNINIVSGMARGIDSVAHLKCINENSYTCAVLGSGLDVIYPKENSKLYDRILENGCIISQFAPGTKPYSYNFPIRNRIISGLSNLIIVVEGGKKSGSLITAGAALEQGKDVMVIPGNIFSPQSIGTNKLIKDGAYVFTEINDIYDILNIENHKEENIKKVIMSGIERNVYKYIGNEPIHFDDILKLTKVDINKLYETLLKLQLSDEIISLSSNYYVRNNKVI
ncbi:DNA-processing protein DprA [Clostridium brassicae]|uniref:DNA-processing protein DprA n=1 Tax=Clostridium brassicae TaxID=2999072 RepID=A0ABT4D7J8_9CLOT|nr:DNA-processing protein DprA [Clostridium brassicae]MCY6958271.1 DNA-processing protein DprA [Clostridium brassicae]